MLTEQIPPGLTSQSMTFIIADDHNLVRDGLKLMVSGMLPNIRFLEADDADSLLGTVRSAPEARLALVDLNMPGMEKGALLADLSRGFPKLPLVAISALTSPDVVRRTLDIPSVHAFVPKSATADHMRLASTRRCKASSWCSRSRPKRPPRRKRASRRAWRKCARCSSRA